MSEWAEAHRLKRGQVKSWVLPRESGGRSIPRKWADVIEGEFLDAKGKSLVPATESTWRNKIKG